MPFDPDAYLAAKTTAPPSASAFDPDAYLTARGGGVELEPSPPPERAKSESFLRGVLQGVTFGHADEIAAAIEAPFSDKTYREIRDAKRGQYKAAEAANPKTYLAGEIGGSLITPGAGVAKGVGKGATTVMQLAKTGAKQGALSGLGHSEKEGADALQDAAVGAAFGGVVSGVVGKAVRSAPARAVRRMIGDITDGATATMRDKLSGKAGKKVEDVIDLLRKDKELGNVIRKEAAENPGRALQVVEQRIDDVGSKIGAAYEAGDKVAQGVLVKDVTGALRGLQKELSNPVDKPLRESVERLIGEMTESWGAGARDRIPMAELNRTIQKLQKRGYAGSLFDPSTGKELQRDSANALREVLEKRFAEVAGLADDLAGKPKLLAQSPALKEFAEKARAVKEIKALNKQYSTLARMQEALEYRATREATPSTKLKDRISSGIDVGLALADPTGAFVAKKAYDWVGKPVGRAIDYRLAQLVSAAQAGSTPAQLGQMAVELGLARATGEGLANWANRKLAGDAQPLGEAELP